LLLVTILLVLVAAVTLLIGIFSDNLALIFVSIGASALAAIVLAVLSQVSRRKDRAATSGATPPEPLAARDEVPARAAGSIATTGEPVVRADEAPTETIPAVPAATSPSPVATASTAPAELPIAGYATLRVNEILPKLDALDLDELETVAQYEETNKNRTTVLNRIDALMDELEAAEAGATTTPTTSTAAAEPATTAVDDEVAEAAAESIEELGEPVVALAAPTAPSETAGVGSAGGDFPIADYDSLSEDEVIARLQDLDADQLETVADREEAGPNRDAVLDAIDDRLDILEGIVPAPAAPAPVTPAPGPTAARKAPAKKAAAAKKAPVRKATAAATPAPAPARKAATPARKTAAKKSPATAAPAATTAKAAASKATTKAAATAKKAPAKKAAAAVKAPARKATVVKKATPVKRATAAKKTTGR
jgi:hypothetical protein